MSATPAIRTAVVERDIAHPPEKIWRALTQPHLIEEWLMKSDFTPVEGQKFTFRNQPKPDITVVVDCEVLAVEPHRTLSYSWAAYGLETVVTFTLEPTPTGTLLRMEQTGFRPQDDLAYKGAKAAWKQFIARLDEVVSGLDQDPTKENSVLTNKKASTGDTAFSDAEREAMQAAKSERKKGKKGDGLADLLAKIAELNDSDRAIAETIHALVTEHAPGLSPKTWYGMPAWANADGKVVCFLTPAGKFDSRYASFGFNDSARLDDGTVWPTSFAVTRLTKADEEKLAGLIRKAVG